MHYQSLFAARGVQAVFIVLFALSLSVTSFAHSNIKLVSQLRPFTSDNRYGDVWGEGNYAYLASYNGSGVMIIDISDPAAPRMVGHYDPPAGGRFQDVIVANGIGYFSSENNGGVHIVDVRDPAQPRLLNQIHTAQHGFPFVHELTYSDGVLYEADSRTTRVKVFDVRRPEAPVFVRDIQTTDSMFIHAAMAINGRLYTSGWGGRTDIYDIRNVLNAPPPLLGVVETGNNSHSCWPSNDGRLLASARETDNGDVRLFDISDPAHPQFLAAITSESLGHDDNLNIVRHEGPALDSISAHNPYIVGNMLFVSWYQAGVVAVDISDPRQPKFAGDYDTFSGPVASFDGCWGVFPFLGFDRVLLSDLDGGLFVVDATEALAGPRTVSAASYQFTGVAPGAIVAAFGTRLSAGVGAAASLPLPMELAGARITVQDFAGVERNAPLFFVSPSQINYQVPLGSAPGPALLKFTNPFGQTFSGAAIIRATAPTLFTIDQSGRGAAAALDAFTYAPAPFNATRATGEPNIIALFGSGLGANATDTDGNVASSCEASLDGRPVTINYAGRAPGLVGVNQFNLILPVGIASGAHQLVIRRGAAVSNTVTLVIK